MHIGFLQTKTASKSAIKALKRERIENTLATNGPCCQLERTVHHRMDPVHLYQIRAVRRTGDLLQRQAIAVLQQ
jgi:hypothetical protein